MTESEQQFHIASSTMVECITDFSSQLDTVFSHIASNLPNQLSLIESVSASLGPDNNPMATANIPDRLTGFEHNKNSIDSNVRNGLLRFSTVLTTAEASLEQVQTHTTEIEDNCDNLNLFSLNTRLATKHSLGISASTFRAITLELTERSRSIATLAAQLQQTLRHAVVEFGQIKGTQKALTISLDQLAIKQQTATETTKLHMNQLQTDLSEIQLNANQLSEALRPRVQHIMIHIQEQDIIRQSLAHIQKVLRQSGNTGDMEPAGKAQFIQQACELSATLIAESRQHLTRFVAETENGLNELTQLGDHIKKLKSILASRNDLTQHILAPVDYLMQQNTLLKSLLDTLNETSGKWQHMRLQLKATSVTGRTMKSIATDLALLEVTMRINGTNDPTLETETNALATDFRQIYTAIRQSLKQISKMNTEILEQSISLDMLDSTLQQIAALDSTLSLFRADAIDAIAKFYTVLTQSVQTVDLMTGFAADAEERLQKMMTCFPEEKDLFALVQLAGEYASHILQQVPVTGNPINDQPTVSKGKTSAQLAELISEFAVFTQKMTAGALMDISMEQGDEEGELTLF